MPVSNNTARFVVPFDEQIQLVQANTGAFTAGLLALGINPGNPAAFPFLSRTAKNYERYEFQDICFEYKPSAGNFADQGKLGFVGISVSDDALQAPPSTQQIAEVFLHSDIVLTSKPTSICVNKKFMESSTKQLHFVRPNGLIPGGADAHLYDCMQVFFWAVGQAAAGQIGEYRVYGHVLLCNPVLEASSLAPTNFSASQLVSSAGEAIVTATPYTVQFADTTAADGFVNNLQVVNAAGSLLLPVGNYYVEGAVRVVVTGGTATSIMVGLQKNGANVFPTNAAFVAAVGPTSLTLPFSGYVSVNGTDTLNVNVNDAFTGTAAVFGHITILAV
jgi:hypothetical protein